MNEGYQCIGQVKQRVGGLLRCPRISQRPTNDGHPEWGWLCPNCANAAPTGSLKRNSRGIIEEKQ